MNIFKIEDQKFLRYWNGERNKWTWTIFPYEEFRIRFFGNKEKIDKRCSLWSESDQSRQKILLKSSWRKIVKVQDRKSCELKDAKSYQERDEKSCSKS
jgi:hypothetical protein